MLLVEAPLQHLERRVQAGKAEARRAELASVRSGWSSSCLVCTLGRAESGLEAERNANSGLFTLSSSTIHRMNVTTVLPHERAW